MRRKSLQPATQKTSPTIEPGFLQQRLQYTRLVLLGEAVADSATVHTSLFETTTARPVRTKAGQTTAQSSWWQFVWRLWSGGLVIMAIIVAVLWWGPDIWHRLSGQTTQAIHSSIIQSFWTIARTTGLPVSQFPETEALAVTPIAGQSGQSESYNNQEPPTNQSLVPADAEVRYWPVVNLNLPAGDWLVIPKIGVRSRLQATANYQDALETGLWRAPGFGKPGSLEIPMIVAGHRYGRKWWWQDEYWKYNSFNLLPELQVGDRVEVISEQRKWTYEIYAGEEGSEITDYQADLILYTCKHLQSPLRHIRYARLLEE